ncbi:MAG: TM0106 family RecB-like putative nuclease [Gemmatimonadetes bacterium]|nr:TM0106 family RecB-like putative nuclease [Gemmatimonadota bacterium]MYH18974.1 TM0106 family RecB-like putative nuclease [Gemmatimonadota bacterium]
MQRTEDGGCRFSATDLVYYLGCRHATYLDLRSLEEDLEKAESDETMRLLQRKGLEHEKAYLERLRTEGRDIVEIDRDGALQGRAAATRSAMESGADVIFQAVLHREPWRGDADFLVRCPRPSALGDYSYEVLDTKLAKTAAPKHLIQLCVYTDLLEGLQELRPEFMYLLQGDGKKACFRVDDFYYYYALARRRFEAWIAEPPSDTNPDPCAHCTYCHWRDLCARRWEDDDHLSRVANIRKTQIAALRNAGINTLSDLACLDAEKQIADTNQEGLARLRAQAALQYGKAKTGKDAWERLDYDEGKGLSRLPAPDRGDLFFDMEGDPLYPNGLEYLFGAVTVTDDRPSFKAFWAHNHGQENKAFEDFMAFLDVHLGQYPSAYIYHYNHYETTALKRLAGRYGTCEEQLDNLLRRNRFVDLYLVVRESIRTSEPRYSLKNLETFYMQRSGEVATAAESVVVYNRWQETGEDDLLRQIAEYNEADCVSTWKLRDWLVSLRPARAYWFGGDENGGDESGGHDSGGHDSGGEAAAATQASPGRKDWEIEYEEYQRRLGVFEEYPPEDGRRIADLLEFHNREAKPEWWAAFERRDKTTDELIEDVECLGGLEKSGDPPVQVKRSTIYTFRFPPQDFKLKTGDQVANAQTMDRAGSIQEIDESKGIVRVRQGPSVQPLPSNASIGPGGPVDAKVIRAGIYRHAERFIRDGKTPRAATDLLRRAVPRIKGRTPGAPIVEPGREGIDGYLDAVAHLDDSYLFIQGPPGAGKTYTSGHLIVALIERGHTVGITSNAHQAIHNLLDMVVEVARDRGVSFRGIKKSSGGNPDSVYKGEFVTNVERTGDIGPGADLYAGTACLFSDPSLVDRLDYLFIDEAGQVSTANVVGMSSSTKNIVLVGDQMQLGQPMKGTHPGEAGMSVLEYLLQGKDTIPADRGIFLGTTWRLKPSICRFVSGAFYDGRLENHAETAERRLLLEKTELPEEGIVMIAADHARCSQKSEEEGKVVRACYDELLGQSFADGRGRTRSLTAADILVVSPYNVQVNHLRSALPDGARVGTVDKFQGQEAPVVLVSMVTSTAEDLPRHMEFLYSRNRLNVAVSRAQCLAIVVLNPRLLEAPCRTVEHMRLVNVFCRLEQYAYALTRVDRPL